MSVDFVKTYKYKIEIMKLEDNTCVQLDNIYVQTNDIHAFVVEYFAEIDSSNELTLLGKTPGYHAVYCSANVTLRVTEYVEPYFLSKVYRTIK